MPQHRARRPSIPSAARAPPRPDADTDERSAAACRPQTLSRCAHSHISSRPWGQGRCTRRRAPVTTNHHTSALHVLATLKHIHACEAPDAASALYQGRYTTTTFTWYCCWPSAKGAGAGAASKAPTAGAPQSAPSAAAGAGAASKPAAGVPSHWAAAASAGHQT